MRRVALVALVAAACGVLFVAAHLHLRGGVSGFVQANTVNTDPAAAPDDLTVAESGYGYDGQFMYRLAVAPLSTADRVDGVALDQPRYRQQRIGYPLLTWVASGGQRAAVPWALIVVNVAAFAAVAALGAVLARDMGRSVWWGLAFAACPGFVASLSRDLGEIVAGAFLLAALLALRRERWGWVAVALTAAVLTRDTAVLFPVAIGLVWVVRRTPRPVAFLVPIAVFGGWQVALRAMWPDGRDVRGENVTLPGKGLVDTLSNTRPDHLYYDLELVLIAGLVLVVAAAAISRAGGVEMVALVLFAVLAVSMSHEVWQSWWSASRSTSELYLMSVTALVPVGRRAAPVLAAVGGMTAVAVAQALVLWPQVAPPGAL